MDWIYMGYFGSFSKKFIKYNSNSSQFWENENLRFWGNREEWVFLLTHSILSHFEVLNKGMNFSFPPLKLQNKGREEYSKIILFIPFHSIPSPPSKQGLKLSFKFLDLGFYNLKKKKNSKKNGPLLYVYDVLF